MSIESVKIFGYRGFAKEQSIELSKPNGQPCSGLNFLVGANNAGKSSFVEAINLCLGRGDGSASIGERNIKSGRRVEIEVRRDGELYSVKTIKVGGSELDFERPNINGISQFSIKDSFLKFIPAKRVFTHMIQKPGINIHEMFANYSHSRAHPNIPHVTNSLFDIIRDDVLKAKFDKIIRLVVGYDLSWNLDSEGLNSYNLYYYMNGLDHKSEGLGDGITSLFMLVATLVVSKEGDTIIIDEPEISLHPQVQRKLFDVLKEESSNKQILISTHSPYFIDYESIYLGATVIRFNKVNDEVNMHQLSSDFVDNLEKIMGDPEKAYTLGIEAREYFFARDNLVIVEGVEDIVCLKRGCEHLGLQIDGELIGYGAGGKNKIPLYLELLRDLGYKKIAVVLDNNVDRDNENEEASFVSLDGKFGSEYSIQEIKTYDLRDKKYKKGEGEGLKTSGYFDTKFNLKSEYVTDFRKLINDLNSYFKDEASVCPSEITVDANCESQQINLLTVSNKGAVQKVKAKLS